MNGRMKVTSVNVNGQNVVIYYSNVHDTYINMQILYSTITHMNYVLTVITQKANNLLAKDFHIFTKWTCQLLHLVSIIHHSLFKIT